MQVHIIKLGGSVITDKKSGNPVIYSEHIKALCSALVEDMKRHKDTRYIVLHGAGSMGHPLAKKYDLVDKPFDYRRLLGMGKTVANMRAIVATISEIFHEMDVPAIPLQTSSLLHKSDGEIIFDGKEIVTQILEHGGVPILGGDVVVTSDGKTAIASADALAVLLAKTCAASNLTFASDVAGVYETFPPNEGEVPIPNISREELENLIQTTGTSSSETDVTGGMRGKLKTLLGLKDITIRIIDGSSVDSFAAALAGESTGTKIAL